MMTTNREGARWMVGSHRNTTSSSSEVRALPSHGRSCVGSNPTWTTKGQHGARGIPRLRVRLPPDPLHGSACWMSAGSSPACSTIRDRVAQLEERFSDAEEAAGSSPVSITISTRLG